MVAIITLNYNQNEYTLKCVESILKSDYNDFKLFLVDNGSTSDNYEKLKKHLPVDDRLLLVKIDNNLGYVGGINHGLAEANKIEPNYFLIMNNDTIIDENALTELRKTCNDFNDKAIVSGKVYHYDEPDIFQDVGHKCKDNKSLKFERIGVNEKDTGQYEQVVERDLLDDVFWLFPFSLYKKIGGYSSHFWFSAEQADFAFRARNEGYKLIYTPKAKLWHKGSVSIGGRSRNPKLAYWHVQSTLILRYIHLSKGQFTIQYFKILKGIVSSYIKEFKNKKDNFEYANAKLKGLLYFNKWFFVRNNNTGKNPFN